jgi:hypothetical protein
MSWLWNHESPRLADPPRDDGFESNKGVCIAVNKALLVYSIIFRWTLIFVSDERKAYRHCT